MHRANQRFSEKNRKKVCVGVLHTPTHTFFRGISSLGLPGDYEDRISYNNTPAATARFSELTLPAMGRRTNVLQAAACS